MTQIGLRLVSGQIGPISRSRAVHSPSPMNLRCGVLGAKRSPSRIGPTASFLDEWILKLPVGDIVVSEAAFEVKWKFGEVTWL